MTPAVEESYAECQRAARAAASNFYPCFRVLPPPKRRAMYALYAYFRQTDDITDDDSAADSALRRDRLNQWRSTLEATLAGEHAHAISPALKHAVDEYGIPHEYLFAALDGAEMDLDHQPYETIADLESYCYKVASAVGLACIHVWGFHEERALEPAIQCGYAFQMTNILRDIKDDASRGRIYLPMADLARFDYTAEELHRGVIDQRYRELMAFEIERTTAYYHRARELHGQLHPHGQAIFRVMMSAYSCLFQAVRRRHGDSFSRRISIGWSDRLRLAAGIWLSPALLPGP